MSTLNEQLYIDTVVVKGTKRIFSVKIDQEATPEEKQQGVDWTALDLSLINVRFRVLGSAEGNGIILIEKIITQSSDEDTIGTIADPASGEFTFTITVDDTEKLGLGSFPIIIELLDVQTGEVIHTLTEGGIANAEFNKITVVRV